MEKLKIVQWNARSLVNKKAEFLSYLHLHKVDIVAVSETWFRPDRVYTYRGYNVFREDRADGRSGVAVLLRRSISYSLITNLHPINNLLHVAISITLPNNFKISLVSLYNSSNNNISQNDWKIFFNSVPKPALILGDFNCHHSSLGSSWTDAKGRNLLDAAHEANLIYLNDGSPTFVNHFGSVNASAVDISFVSTSIGHLFEWSVDSDPLSSDHLPILIQCNSAIAPRTGTVSNYHGRRWNVARADWNLFRHHMSQATNYNLDDRDNYLQFIQNINSACELSIPQRNKSNSNKIKNNTHFNSWWNNDCKIAINERKIAYQNYKRCSNLSNFVDYKRKVAKAKRILKEARKKSWYNFCSNLSKTTPIKTIWTQIKMLKNRRVDNLQPTILGDWTDEFLRKLAPDFVQQAIDIPVDYENHSLNQYFTLFELLSCVKSNINTSPGKDQIVYPIIKNLPDSSLITLLEIFNNILSSGKCPESWKDYVVVPILKNGKPANIYNSYRPISLSSCLLKTFERMIKNRLEWWLEKNNKIPASQYGFRKGKSTAHSLAKLTVDIQLGFTSGRSTLALFVDIEGAYDNVVIPILVKKLKLLDIPSNIINCILGIISERRIYLKINSILKGPLISRSGLPQGGILSPLLYTIYTADIEDILPLGVNILQYADDICLYHTSHDLDESISKLNETVLNLNDWCLQNGLSLSVSKSVVCMFTRKRNYPLHTQIELGHKLFRVDQQVKFLGMYLDRKLLWKMHIEYIRTKVQRYLNILQLVTYNNWGADPNIALLFYRACIRSVIDYGCSFYGNACRTVLQSIDRLQYKSIRMCLGLLNSTPIDALLNESGELPLRHRRKILTSRFILRTMESSPELYANIFQLGVLDLTHLFWQKKQSPPLASATTKIAKYHKLITHSNKIAVYNTDFHFEQSFPVVYLNDIKTDNPDECNCSFLDEVYTKWPDAYLIFTDGSKLEGKCGCSFYDPQRQFEKMIKVNDIASVYTCELVAILEALRYLLSNKITDTCIFTDSQSALLKLEHFRLSSSFNHIECSILKTCLEMKNMGLLVRFVWIRAHIGISGNERADLLAKRATLTGQPSDVKIPVSDFFSKINIDTINQWQKEYGEGSKGKFFKIINPEINKKPWFQNLEKNKRFCRVISRLRINHGLCREYLHKIGVERSPLCPVCGVNESLEHIVMVCPRYTDKREELFSGVVSRLANPFSYVTMLEEARCEVYELLIRFFDQIHHKV